MPGWPVRMLSLLAASVLQLAGSGVVGDGVSVTPSGDLAATVDHPLVPLATVSSKIFTGEEVDAQTGRRITTRIEETVRPRQAQVTGIDVTVVDVDDYHDGALHDVTEEYFAQGADGTVYYLGERVDEFARPQGVTHEGTWLAGNQGTAPGVFMPAEPVVGMTFSPEHVPDLIIEQATVIAVAHSITTAAGTFHGCLVTKEIGLPMGVTEEKTYCPEVGLVYEEFADGYLELVQVGTSG